MRFVVKKRLGYVHLIKFSLEKKATIRIVRFVLKTWFYYALSYILIEILGLILTGNRTQNEQKKIPKIPNLGIYTHVMCLKIKK